MKRWLFILLQYLIPHHFLSRLVGRITASQNRWLSQWLIRRFCKLYPIDLTQAQRKNMTEYLSMQDFFIRQLTAEARPIPPHPHGMISPVDGMVSQFGHIQQQKLIQAKGKDYTLSALLGSHQQAAAFANGQFMTIYLAPHDYHRVHMPVTGTLTHMTYVPGRLFSVQPATMQQIAGLLTRNERVICYFETHYGPMAVILVGAMIVASIATTWHGTVTPANASTPLNWDYTGQNITLQAGAELGYFNFGSTVVLLCNHPNIQWQLPHAPAQLVRLGEYLTQEG